MYPEIVLSDSIVIPTYLVFLSLLYCFLIFYAHHRADKMRLPARTTMDFALIMMVAGFLGGRLLHVFFEAPTYYRENWLRIFYFWQGGFVFYGGFLAAFFCCLLFYYFNRKNKSFKHVSALGWMDFFAPILALGYGLGRITCFLAGCCYGAACDLPWAATFPWDLHGIARHPVQLYMTVWELLVYAGLILLEKRKLVPGRIFFIWLSLHALGRLLAEQFRDDFRGNFIAGLSLSTLISIILLAASLAILVFDLSSKKIKAKIN